MDLNRDVIPSSTVAEDAIMFSEDDNRITIEQQNNIHLPKPEEYLAISKWDMNKMLERCKNLEKRPAIISDICLTIGSLSLGAFFSGIFGGLTISNNIGKSVFYVISAVVGTIALIVAFFLKKEEHGDAKKAIDDIIEILNHTLERNEEN